MDEPLDELYFKWLYSQVGSVRLRNRARTYWSLLRLLFTKEFVWIIPNDDNRVEDGRALRSEFIHTQEIDTVDNHWMELGCSFLEMLVALARWLAFEAEGEPREWFWHLIDTLGLSEYNDKVGVDENVVHEAMDRVIWRTYAPSGEGGLFPLKNPQEDQRDVEIWYQLNAYLLEHY